VEVPEVERLREQVRRLEDREAGLSALLEHYGRVVADLRADLDGEIMERAAMRAQADRDRVTMDALRRAGAEHFGDAVRMRGEVQKANAEIGRLQDQADRARRDAAMLRFGAIVEPAPPPGYTPRHGWRGLVVHVESGAASSTPSVLVWWVDPIKPADVTASPEWATPDGLRVIG
jgi:hypothetical protein